MAGVTEQHTATHCNLLQHTATHLNTLQHTATHGHTHCNTLQHTASHCNTLQHTATHCNTQHNAAPHRNTLQHTATHCIALQHAPSRNCSTEVMCVSSSHVTLMIESCNITYTHIINESRHLCICTYLHIDRALHKLLR